ncbi:MAG: DNA polymerase III subunit delta [Bacteroidetes bacterium]|nr:MAG: DNA polymerase III subunit delta [Bacteroidota bacterium]
MEFEKIISDLKNKVYHPVYFLMGEEPYFIDEVANYIEKNVMEDSEKEFNQTILYGGETNILQVISEAKSYPMMSNYRVVIVREAQNMKGLVPKIQDAPALKGDKDNKRPPPPGKGQEGESLHPLEFYLNNPQKSTILVFCHKYKTIDLRTSFAKALSKKAVVMRSDKMYDNKVPGWAEGFIKEKKYSMEPNARQLLTEYLGNDLSKIAMEVEKLMINLPAGTQITSDHIQKYIGISKEYNNFELQAAIGKRDALKANRIINYFASNPKDNPLVMTIALLGGYFSKILAYHYLPDKSQNNVAATLKVNPFFVKDYTLAAGNYPPGKTMDVISLLRQYDLRSKGIDGNSIDDGELLKEIVFKIIH